MPLVPCSEVTEVCKTTSTLSKYPKIPTQEGKHFLLFASLPNESQYGKKLEESTSTYRRQFFPELKQNIIVRQFFPSD